MKTVPYWNDHTDVVFSNKLVETLPSKIDVAIIGGGYTGLNSALTLAKSGLSVAVFEKGFIACGASGKNAGMLLPGVKAPIEKVFKTYGESFTKSIWQWTLSSIDYVRSLVKNENISCDWQESGSLELACRERHLLGFVKKIEFLSSKLNYERAKLVDSNDLRSEVKSSSFCGGIIDESAAMLNPLAYLRSLASLVRKNNIPIFENSCIKKIEVKKNSTIKIFLNESLKIECRKVLIATNGYTPNNFKKLRRKIFPIESCVITTDIIPSEIRNEILPKTRAFYDSKKLLNYFRLTGDGRLLFGGRDRLSCGIDLVKSQEQLRAKMIDFFPQLRAIPIIYSWSGRLAVTTDMLPHLEKHGDIYLAYGYCGHGVSMASYLGHQSAEFILEKSVDEFHFKRKKSLSTIPYCDPLILPFLSKYYKIYDEFL